MTVIARALQIRRGLSNVGRMREISAAVSRYGFGELFNRLGITRSKKILEDGQINILSAPERLRMLLESLGPTFIKIGQLAAGRPDLIPPEFLIELEKLQDRVEAIPYTIIKNLVEENFRRKLEDVFTSFDPLPLASASIAQVHTARTLSGEDVIVKIQKPDVERILNKDFEILILIAELAESTFQELRPFHIVNIVKEFRRLILQEIDFQRESQNIKRYRENFSSSDFLVIPRVFDEYSSKKIITLERIQGFRITEVDQYARYNIDPNVVLKKGLDHHMQSLMVYGLFHADPHGGNMLVMHDGRLALLDFGSVGWLSPRSRNSLINLFLALVSEDYEALIDEYLEISPHTGNNHSSEAREALTREATYIMAPYFGTSLKNIPAAKLMLEVSSLAFKYHIQLPQDLIAVFKSNMTLEGIGRTLDPDFDLLASALKFAKNVLRNKLQPQSLMRSFVRSSRDVQRFAQKAPRLGLEIMRQIESGQLEVKLKNSEWDKFENLERSKQGTFILSIIFIGSVIFCGNLLTTTQFVDSNLLRIGESFALVSLAFLILKFFKRD